MVIISVYCMVPFGAHSGSISYLGKGGENLLTRYIHVS